MAINTYLQNVADYNSYTVTAMHNLLRIFQFVWFEPSTLIPGKIIRYSEGEWQQGDPGVVSTLPYELTGASFDIDLDDSNVFVCELVQNVVITDILNSSPGKKFKVTFTQDTTGSRTVTWPEYVSVMGALNPAINSATVCSAIITNYTYLAYGVV